jgi:photosystem II PsbU protein
MKALVRLSVTAIMVATFWVVGLTGSFSEMLTGGSALANDLPETSFIEVDSSKIDLNNSNINAFRKVPGFYPTLGRIIIQNAPYNSLDDVLNIAGLTEDQKTKISSNAEKFTLKKPDNSMNRERINNSIYRL